MCDIYAMTKPRQVRGFACVARGRIGNLPPLPGIFPDTKAPVIINTSPNDTREMHLMRWGFPHAAGEKSKPGYVTNVRHANSIYWRPYLLRPQKRCLVPVTSFCEPDNRSGRVVWTWFALDENRPIFFFAGIWRRWNGVRGTKRHPVEGDYLIFSFLTTAPNAEVGAVQNKDMPVLLLDEAARETWLNGTVEEALRLQRPAPNGTLKIVATSSKEDLA